MILRKKIGIFGGSFNPFHDGHLKICEFLLKNNYLNEIIILPNKDKFFRKTIQISNEHKINIIKMFIKDHKNILLCDYELKKNDKAYTIDSIKYLKKNRLFNCDLYFIIGQDNYSILSKWKNYEKLIKTTNFLVIQRKNNIKLINNKNFIFLENPIFNFSSTEIRLGENFHKYNVKLIEYINKNVLFWEERLNNHLMKPRIIHSLNVAKLAIKYGVKYNLNSKELFFAGIYHDYFKNIKDWSILEHLKKEYLLSHEINYPLPTLHGYIASNYFKKKWYFNNEVILNSIKYHTTPSLSMSLFEKIIYCADKLSKDRKEDDLLYYRQLCEKNIEIGFQKVLYRNLFFLIKTKKIFDEYFVKLSQKYLNSEEKEKIISELSKLKKNNNIKI